MSAESQLHCLHFLPKLDGGRTGEGGRQEGGRSLRSWTTSFSLLSSGEELQTVKEIHPAVYLHFSISSHSSLQSLKDSTNRYRHLVVGGAALSAVPALPRANATGEVSALVYIYILIAQV